MVKGNPLTVHSSTGDRPTYNILSLLDTKVLAHTSEYANIVGEYFDNGYRLPKSHIPDNMCPITKAREKERMGWGEKGVDCYSPMNFSCF